MGLDFVPTVRASIRYFTISAPSDLDVVNANLQANNGVVSRLLRSVVHRQLVRMVTHPSFVAWIVRSFFLAVALHQTATLLLDGYNRFDCGILRGSLRQLGVQWHQRVLAWPFVCWDVAWLEWAASWAVHTLTCFTLSVV